jgi:hypothetical protein
VGALGVGVVNAVVGIGMEDFETKKKTANPYSMLATSIRWCERKTHYDGKE